MRKKLRKYQQAGIYKAPWEEGRPVQESTKVLPSTPAPSGRPVSYKELKYLKEQQILQERAARTKASLQSTPTVSKIDQISQNIVDVALNPATAASRLIKGQPITGMRADRNILDHGLDFINPAAWAEAIRSAPGKAFDGDVLGAALDLTDALPVAGAMAKTYKAAAPLLKFNSKVRSSPDLPRRLTHSGVPMPTQAEAVAAYNGNLPNYVSSRSQRTPWLDIPVPNYGDRFDSPAFLRKPLDNFGKMEPGVVRSTDPTYVEDILPRFQDGGSYQISPLYKNLTFSLINQRLYRKLKLLERGT